MPDARPTRSAQLPAALLALTLAALAWSAWRPHDRLIWALEVSPAVAATVLLVWTRRRFPLTPLLYTLVFVHAVVLIVGGHYTYARVPPGDWLRDWLDLERNHYDRFGHFMQGFTPAIAAREVLLRTSPLRPGAWLFFLCVCVCVAISGVYELLEWAVALIGGAASTEFLGTQGDVWDTQKDIAWCLVGAMAALLSLSRRHDRQVRALGAPGA